ncbi:glycoside hydrolase family 16 protein [Corynebacterium aquilae]|uniref:glycoside hydrolase family 16 protein n=1 Tax=Corynebacterium aquilae TaxID=203263 RepID=UPI00095257F2|nr:family 16 glycosylhydrolase [Corynebacterium aquilae]
MNKSLKTASAVACVFGLMSGSPLGPVSAQAQTREHLGGELANRSGATPGRLESHPLTSYTLERIEREPYLEKDAASSSHFDAESDIDHWHFFERDSWLNPAQKLSRKNVTIHDGVLDIVTRRHCLSGSETQAPENVSESPCDPGEVEKFSGARIHGPKIPAGNFRVQVRAKATAESQIDGLRPSIWMQNDTSYCSQGIRRPYGELDITEFYTSRATTNYSATHLGCYKPSGGSENIMRRKSVENMFDSWHVWGVEVFDGQIVYTFDGEPVGLPVTAQDSHYLNEGRFSAVLNQPWHLILNNLVERDGAMPWVAHVDPQKDFPEQHFLIDEVLVQVEKRSDSEPGVFEEAPEPSVDGGDPAEDGSSLPGQAMLVLLSVLGILGGVLHVLLRAGVINPGFLGRW